MSSMAPHARKPPKKKPVARAKAKPKPKPKPKVAPVVATPSAPPAQPQPQAPAAPPPPPAVYQGAFGKTQAERLLWRAGFGPAKGEAERLASLGLQGAVASLMEPPQEVLTGPAAVDRRGNPIAPQDALGHDHLWWLDRMVRGNQPLVERMTLVWHDWFATSRVGVSPQKLLVDQNQLFRRHALGSFRQLLLDVTADPAMLIWLDGQRNGVRSPNENYARELMELFTIGAGRGYTEQDVREQARALTGFRSDFVQGVGRTNFRYDPASHDAGTKTVFGKRGAFTWQDACTLCLEHASHPSFFVEKLWSYFIPTPPSAETSRSLQHVYTSGGYTAAPVVQAILLHPDLHQGGRMVKPPVVLIAGMLRALGRPVDTEAWASLSSTAGQQLFVPPNVAGWDETRWLDTNTFRGRWLVAAEAVRPTSLGTRNSATHPRDPHELVARAIAYWDNPTISEETQGTLRTFVWRALEGASSRDVGNFAVYAENALRVLVAMSPDYQTS